jgi:hypothetical protein
MQRTPSVVTVTTLRLCRPFELLCAEHGDGRHRHGQSQLGTALTYDRQGDVAEVDGPRSDVSDISDFTYDADRRPVFAIQPDPDGAGGRPRPAAKTVYDVLGRAIETDRGTTTPNGTTSRSIAG